jgi:hypothetical protein
MGTKFIGLLSVMAVALNSPPCAQASDITDALQALADKTPFKQTRVSRRPRLAMRVYRAPMYYDGIDVEIDHVQALYWLRRQQTRVAEHGERGAWPIGHDAATRSSQISRHQE